MSEEERAFVERLASDRFAFLDEFVAERDGVAVEEIRRQKFRLARARRRRRTS